MPAPNPWARAVQTWSDAWQTAKAQVVAEVNNLGSTLNALLAYVIVQATQITAIGERLDLVSSTYYGLRAGLKVANSASPADVSEMTITADAIGSYDGTSSVYEVDVEADITDAGAGGLDELDTLTAGTWYNLYVIWKTIDESAGEGNDDKEAKGFWSTSPPTSVVLPDGYDHHALIVPWMVDSALELMEMVHIAGENLYKILPRVSWGESITVSGNTTWTDCDLSAYLPAPATAIVLDWLLLFQAYSTAEGTMYWRPDGSSFTTARQSGIFVKTAGTTAKQFVEKEIKLSDVGIFETCRTQTAFDILEVNMLGFYWR